MVGTNNPFNIRYRKQNVWLGQFSSFDGFSCFSEMEFGIRAACMLVMRTYRKYGLLSVGGIITRFAPPSENKTDNYIAFVIGKMCCFPFTVMNTIPDYVSLLRWMSVFEGNPVSEKQILDVINKYKIVPYKGCRK